MPHPFHTHDDVPGAVLGDHLDRPLAELGVAATPSVLLRLGDVTALVHSTRRSTR